MTKHIYPPTALGSRHSNTSHKFAALLHGLRLECESWLDVQGVLGMYFAMTTDAGVEKKVLQAQVDSPTALFRYWLPHLSMHGGDELRAGAAATTAEQTQQQEQNAFADQLSMRAILHIPGGFHIVENVVARLLDMLPSWAEAIKPGLEAVCFVFHSRFSRERFVEQCLVGDRAAWKGLFSSGPPTFEGGRVWGTTVKVLEWLLFRETPLRVAWDEDRVQFRARAAGDGDDKAGVQHAGGGDTWHAENEDPPSDGMHRVEGDGVGLFPNLCCFLVGSQNDCGVALEPFGKD